MRTPLRAACIAVAALAVGSAAVAATAAPGHQARFASAAVPTASATITDTEGGPAHTHVAAVPALATTGVTRSVHAVPLDGASGTVVAFANAARVKAARAASAQSVPWIAWVHGGGWVQGSPDDAAATYFCTHAAALGISCFSLGYTLAPAAHWPTQLDEVTAELAWIRAHGAAFNLDPHAGFVFGHSAGALMAGIAGLQDSTGATGSTLAGIGLLDGATDVPTIISSRYRASITRYAGELVGGDAQTAASASVEAHIPAAHDATPVLLVHDAADPIISARLSVDLAGDLERADYPVTLDLLPGSTHYTEYDPTALGAVDAWLAGRLAVVGAQYPAPATSWSPPSKVGLTLSATSVAAGAAVTVTVGVHGYNGPALGTVTIYRNGVRAATATMSSGAAKATLRAPATPGTYVYSARYAGHVAGGHGWTTYAPASSPRHALTVHAKTITTSAR